MRSLASLALLIPLCVVHLGFQDAFAAQSDGANLGDAEAKMFSMGEGYERFMGRWSRKLAPVYVAFAGVKNGDRVLDVGTGTGSLASAVNAAASTRETVGIDPSAAFIASAKKSDPSGRTRFEVGNAQSIHFADGSFDQTMSLLVLNFVPDHEKAVAEMRRVTRPGGVVSACVWDYNAGMEMLRFFWDEAVALDPAAEPKDERHMKLTREGQLGELWKKAGLGNVRERPLEIEQSYASFDDYWSSFLTGAGPAGAYVVALDDDRRRTLESRMRKRVLGNRAGGGFSLKSRAWCARGEVAGA